ncbi:MIOREX complex component 10 [Nakaseomyces glabratus]|nr:MIOREX complex component 10 [Nakaseomyces glabratus]
MIGRLQCKNSSGLICRIHWKHSTSIRRFIHSSTSLFNEGYDRKKDMTNIDSYGVKTTKFTKGIANPTRYLRRSFVPRSKKVNAVDTESEDDKFESSILKTLVIKPCTTVTTGERYDLGKCLEILNINGFQPSNLIPGEIVSFNYRTNGIDGTIMILGQTGSVVCWGVDERTALIEIVPLISEATVNKLEVEEYETEDMDYIEIESAEDLENLRSHSGIQSDPKTNSRLIGDVILINSIEKSEGILDKAAFSSGLSRSTALAVLENAMERHISNTRIITEKISTGLKLKVKESDALKSIGRLFLIRGRLNLYSELIETPDLYWSEPELEIIFKDVSRYLDISPRINILNSKLDYSTDECRAILSLLNERNSSFLEWIIIYLITFEVIFELFHFYKSNQESTKRVEVD